MTPTATRPAVSQSIERAGQPSQAPVARWIDEARTTGVALSNDGTKLAFVTRDGDTLTCRGYSDTDPCKGFVYRGHCHHTTALANLLPQMYPCGNCREKVCAEPHTYCAGCLAQLEAESERIAIERIAHRPSASQQVIHSLEYREAMASLIAGTDIWG
jgi:hypothetical protein